MYTVVYAVCFYVSSLLISIPFLKRFRYSDARMISLLFIALTSFLLSYAFPFKIVFYAVFSATILAAIITLLKDDEKRVRIEKDEIIFAAVFSFFIFLRFLDPAILDAEKFMDSAFMNAILKSTKFPPADPFFAGGELNFYYYFGHVIAAGITLMSFSPPEVGYNIAVAAVAAYSAIVTYGILKEKEHLAIAGLVFVLFSGNLFSVVDLAYRLVHSIPIDGSYYWNATRVIEGTINEFPCFSFIHADLHAHVVAIPIKLLLISSLFRVWRGESIYLPVITASLFATFATNSWDYPLLFACCLASAAALRSTNILAASILSLPLVFALYMSMSTAAAKFEWIAEKSDAVEFLMYAAFPLFLSYVFSANRKIVVLSLPISIPAFFVTPVLAFTLPLMVSSVHGIYKRDLTSALLFAGCLAFILPEFVAVESRMNTVFKFYLTGWILTSLSASINLQWNRYGRYVITSLLACCLLYPIAATPVRYAKHEYTLDGMAFMKAMDGDYWAVKWLQGKTGVIIEEGCTQGALCAYKYGGRVAAFTGNPAVIAWTNHEYVWRRNYTAIAERARDVRTFYITNSCDVMQKIVEKYDVKYIFVGYEERRIFKVTPEKFEKCFRKVYSYAGSAVFVSEKFIN